MNQPLSLRNEPDRKLNFRTLSIRSDDNGAPATLDVDNRSVEVIGATETPVEVFDYERFEIVPEVLLMSGCEMPNSRQVPLLDTHDRYSGTGSVLGSYRDMQPDGDQLLGRVFFSTVPEAEGPFTKLREGHLTDFSAGYRPIRSQWVPDGETAVIQGRSFEGPVKVTTRWRIKELSICPIGADEAAVARGAVHHPNQSTQEANAMNKALRKWLESRGLSQDATEQEAWEFYTREIEKLETAQRGLIEILAGVSQGGSTSTGAGDPGAGQGIEDFEEAQRQAREAERARVNEIHTLCNQYGMEERAQAFIDDETPVEQVRAAVLEHLGNNNPRVPSGRADMGADERDKFRAAAEHGLYIRAGIAIEGDTAPGAQDLAGYSLREIARMCCRFAGVGTGGNAMEMIGRAMNVNDFQNILANVANRALFTGWDETEETWREWCGTGSANDFKTNSVPRLSEFDDLDEIGDDGEYNYAEMEDATEEYALKTFGKLFAITRKTIINDDLGAFTMLPQKKGRAAARAVGDVVYAVLTANAAMGDGVALFHDDHGNLAGSGAVPGVTTIAAGILAMGIQKDLKGLQNLNIRPRFFISPKALEGSAEVFFRSEKFADSGVDATRANPYAGNYFTRVYESRLDADDPAAWYLAAAKGQTVVVYFLNGNQAPYLETKNGWNVDGVELKVRIDCTAKALDWRGLFKDPGD